MQLVVNRFTYLVAASTVCLVLYMILPLDRLEVEVNGNKELIEKNGIVYFQNKPLTGVTVERFPDGTVYMSTEYRNGVKHGRLEEFGFTGAIRHRWNYINGLKEGEQKGWYLEGPKKYSHLYKNGLMHGISQEWFLGGTTFRQRNFKQGIEISQKVYFSTKELHTNYVKKDGAIYGLKSGELCMDFQKEGEIR